MLNGMTSGDIVQIVTWTFIAYGALVWFFYCGDDE